MSLRTHLRAEPIRYEAGIVGAYAGQESFMELGRERARIVFCWCPPTPERPPFLMGSPADEADRSKSETQHRVVLTHGFWLAKHPLSQRQWLAVMPKNPSQRGKGDDFPVDTISWNSAQEFCGQAGLHLPTEAQWEYACRAGHSTPFGIGSGSVLNAQMANFDGNYPYGAGDSAFKWCYRGRTLPGGSFPPNAWGLHDMHGQLWEWCEDAFEALPASEEVDPLHVSAGSQRVLRGGGWISNGRLARSAYRYGYAPDSAVVDFGLRPCPSSTSASSRVAERPKE